MRLLVAAPLRLYVLQPGTRRTQTAFARCRDCRRVSWPGAHAARLDELVRRALRG